MQTSLSQFVTAALMLTSAFGPLGHAHAVERQPIDSIRHEYGRMYNAAGMPGLYRGQTGGAPARWRQTSGDVRVQHGYDVHGNHLEIVETQTDNGRIQEVFTYPRNDDSKPLKQVVTDHAKRTRDIVFPGDETRPEVRTRQREVAGGRYEHDSQTKTRRRLDGTIASRETRGPGIQHKLEEFYPDSETPKRTTRTEEAPDGRLVETVEEFDALGRKTKVTTSGPHGDLIKTVDERDPKTGERTVTKIDKEGRKTVDRFDRDGKPITDEPDDGGDAVADGSGPTPDGTQVPDDTELDQAELIEGSDVDRPVDPREIDRLNALWLRALDQFRRDDSDENWQAYQGAWEAYQRARKIGDPLLSDLRQYSQGPEGNWTCEWHDVHGKIQRGVTVASRPWTWRTVGDAIQGRRWYRVRNQDGEPELNVAVSFLARNGNWTGGNNATWNGGRLADRTSLNRISWGYGMLGYWGGKSELQQSGRNQIRGRWSYGDKEGGTEVWNRAQRRITRIVFKCDGKSKAVPHGTTGRVEYSYEQLRARNSYTSPGNRPKFTIEIYGDNLWGHHLYDLAGALDLSPTNYGYLNRDGNSCGNHPKHVAGISIGVLIWQKAKPGRKMLRLDGLTIPFDFVLNGYPTESMSDTTQSPGDGHAAAATAEHAPAAGATSPLEADQQDVKDATHRFREAAERYKEDRSPENLEQLQKASAALQEAWQNLLEQAKTTSASVLSN